MAGMYWYLDIHPEEHAAARGDSHCGFLADADVADQLADAARPGGTLLDGDAKGVNIKFSCGFGGYALYDFQ